MNLPQCTCTPGTCVTPASCPCVFRGVSRPINVRCSGCGFEAQGAFPRGWRAVKCVCPHCGRVGWLSAVAAGQAAADEAGEPHQRPNGRRVATPDEARRVMSLVKEGGYTKGPPSGAGVGGVIEVAKIAPELYSLVTGEPV